jgi:hypothetical protein
MIADECNRTEMSVEVCRDIYNKLVHVYIGSYEYSIECLVMIQSLPTVGLRAGGSNLSRLPYPIMVLGLDIIAKLTADSSINPKNKKNIIM